MWILIVGIIVLVVVLIVKHSDSGTTQTTSRSQPTRQYTGTQRPSQQYRSPASYSSQPSRPQNISQCIDRTNDRMYSLDSDSSKVCRQVASTRNTSSAAVRQVAQKKAISIDLSWMSSLQSTLEAANTLAQNMAAQGTTTLNQSKFHYYTSLHFRSMLAADFVYAEYSKADNTLKQISNLLVEIGKKNIAVTQSQKSELYQVKDVVKEARRVLLDKVHQLNNQTRSFKMKIYSECGERGKEWYRKIATHD